MRELIVTENITLDGVIDLAGGWFTPTGDGGDSIDNSDLVAVNKQHQRESGAVLLGRQTYNDFKGYWPLQTNDTTGVTDHLNRTTKYVVSSTMKESDWENTTILSGPLAEEMAALKAESGKPIVATGSITLVHALLGAGLVDEYRLFVYPVVIGSGRRLFPAGGNIPGLRLVESRPFVSGVVLLRYRADGAGGALSEAS